MITAKLHVTYGLMKLNITELAKNISVPEFSINCIVDVQCAPILDDPWIFNFSFSFC